MEQLQGKGNVTVNNANSSNGALQFIGYTKIDNLNFAATEEEKAYRQFNAILRWLSPPKEALKLQSFIDEESRANHKLENTGLWFLHSESFKGWLEGSSKLTWVNGGMGCGKTVLFFLAVQRIREICQGDGSKRFGYFYCTSRGPLGQSTAVLLRCLLRQLCLHSKVPTAIETLYNLCDEGLEHRSPTIHELAETLVELVATPNASEASATYYLLIDGLDELEAYSQNELLTELQPLFSQNLLNVHILITSRARRDIEESLQERAIWNLVPVDTKAVQADIRTFVVSEIQSHRALRRLPQETHDEILSRLVDQSNGMFRWAFLQVQSLKALKPPVTSDKVKNMLRNLPKDLDETYDRMLNGLDEFDKPRARRVLIWLVFSARQLYVEELIDACAFDFDKKPKLENKLAPTDLELMLQDLILIRPPIPQDQDTVEPLTHTVMLVHASIREYLVTDSVSIEDLSCQSPYFALQDRGSNIVLAQSCLAYLLCFNIYDLRGYHEEYPLRQYAWYHWEDHIDINAEHCVPTISTAMIRRKARRLYTLIKRYLSQLGDQLAIKSTSEILNGDGEKNYHSGDLDALWAVLQSLCDFAKSNSLDIQSLKTALNIPFFHPQFDEFCPTMITPTTSTEGEPDYSSSETFQEFSLRGRVSSYKHSSLLKSHTWIRLLEILPAVDPSTWIQCRLFGTALEEAPPFAALSYVWGNMTDGKAVIMVEGHVFHISMSQFILLRSMRSRNEDLHPAIWIDALCINQQDNVERQAQVKIMGNIFAQAREVVVGLSNDDASGDKGVHILADLASCTSSLNCSNPTGKVLSLARQKILAVDLAGDWEHVLEIFQHPWWTRTWIIQEIVRGIRAVILFGTMSFNFNIIEQVMLADGFIKQVLREAKSANLAAIERSHGWHSAKEVVHTRLEYQRNGEFSLPMLLWRFKDRATIDPRDRIFAFLGLCNQSELHTLQISYELPPEEVSFQTSQWILQNFKPLDLLSIRSAYEIGQIPHWSSWFLPLHLKTITRRPLNPGLFIGADSFAIYSASGTEHRSILVAEDQAILGVAFDEILCVLGPPTFDMSKKQHLIDLCKEISKTQSSDSIKGPNQKTVESRWRALLANQWPLGTRLGTSTFEGVVLPPQNDDDEMALLEIIDVHLNLCQLEGRRVVITSGGRLGLALQEVLPGDSIVILPGGALPYVLRSQPNSNGWLFLGECYVHDCMEGQIVKSISLPGQAWWTETFKII